MQHNTEDGSPVSLSTPATARRPLLRALAGAGALGVLGVPTATGSVRGAAAGVGVDFKRCKVAFVSDASALDRIAVYYADRNGTRAARYDIAPTTTNTRGYAPLVVEYDADTDRTQIQLAEPRGSLVCVVAEDGTDRTAVTNPTDVCVPTGFNTAPTAAFTVSPDPTVGEPVTVTSTASDPDSPERLFSVWDLDDDGVFEATGDSVTTTFQTPGEKTIRHRVTDDCGASDTATVTITVATSALFEQVADLLGSDVQRASEFGYAVSVDGDTALVGAPNLEAGRPGAAYVFQRDQGGADGWGQVAKLTAAVPEPFDYFGISVSLAGDTAVVGTPRDDDLERSAGAAYVFDRNAGGTDTWTQVAKLTASDGGRSEFFGRAVAVDGDTLLVGAIGFREGVYVFERDVGGPGAWGEVTKITTPESVEFGSAIDLDGDTAIAGDPGTVGDSRFSRSGAAFVFDRNTGGTDAWGQVAKLTASDGVSQDRFGVAVGIDGDTAIVGAEGEGDGGSNAGAAYVFDRNESGSDGWGEVTKLTAPTPAESDFFGFAVSVDGDLVLVGAYGDDEAKRNAGAAYLYERNAGGSNAWGQIAQLTATDADFTDLFGHAVSLEDGTALVGAYFDDQLGFKTGAAYVFE